MNIEELKATSPAYKDIPNGEFAYRVWNAEKEKSQNLETTLPMGGFADRVGLNNEDFKAMLAFSETAGYDPTDRTISSEYIPEDAQGRAIFQGQTFGFGDEIIGGLAAGVDKITGNEQPLNELYTKYRDKERQKMKEYRQNAPGEALAYELGGAVLSPASLLKAPKIIGGMSAPKQAATISGAYGSVYGAGSSEADTAGGVAKDAVTTGLTSALFGLGTHKAFTFVGNKGQKVAKWMKKAQDKPTIENLKIAKNKAYEAVSTSSVRFDSKDLNSLWSGANRIATNNHHEAYKEKAVQGALNMFRGIKNKGEPYTLSQLDKVRQQIAGRYQKNPEQRALGDMMDLIDEVIQRKGGEFPQMAAARLANTRYKKAEKLEDAFRQVSVLKQSNPTLSEVDLYRGAVTKLLGNKKNMKWYSEEERTLMEQFVKGDIAERVLHRTAAMAPGESKLVNMLAFAGTYLKPIFLVPTGAGMIAKKISDKNVRAKAAELVKHMGGIKTPQVNAMPGAAQVGTASAVNQSQTNY
jgi:hypothetical protein